MEKLFIPKKLKIGFQERSGTYTGKLTYVIYYDEKGVLRKERSWDSWRSKSIEPIEIDNEPIEGLVLNKKVGGHSNGWNHRQTYTRVWDSRDFEYEITVENLLYILEYCSSIKGKGLEGKFVYAWSGKDLVLLPVDSPDYKKCAEYTDKIANATNYKIKDLQINRIYADKDGNEYLYLGKFDYYHRDNTVEKLHYFYNKNTYSHIYTTKSMTKKFVEDYENVKYNYAEIMDKLEYKFYFVGAELIQCGLDDSDESKYLLYKGFKIEDGSLKTVELGNRNTYYGRGYNYCLFYRTGVRYQTEKICDYMSFEELKAKFEGKLYKYNTILNNGKEESIKW
jgi:hypothetical protein